MYWHAVTWTKGSLWFKSTKTDLGVVATRVSTPPTFIYHGMGRFFNPYFYINALGSVAGSFQTKITEDSAGPWHALFLKSGSSTDFGTLAPDGAVSLPYSFATGLNAFDKVVGYSAFAQSADPEFAGHRAFSWKPGGYLVNLGALPGYDFSEAWAVNDLGVVAGRSYNVAPSGSPQAGARACLWWGSTILDLGTLGGNNSMAQGINVRGDVIGISTTAASSEYRAFIKTSGVFGLLKLGLPGPIFNMGPMRDLGTLGGPSSHANDLNAARQVVGYSNAPLNSPTTGGGNVDHAFLWQNGVMQDLGAGEGRSEATAINASGQVVGYLYPHVLAQ
jgi:probable HAF family extracellular repeat protein